MAKKDPFEKFREATLGGSTQSPLRDAITPKDSPTTTTQEPVRAPVRPVAPVAAAPSPTPEKPGKNENRELVSFHLDKGLKHQLGFLKFKTGKSYNDLYNEAVQDLLNKYGEL